MPITPYDEFGRAYPNAAATVPSPVVSWIESNTLGLTFVPPIGEPDALNQVLAKNSSGAAWLWKWIGLPAGIISVTWPPDRLTPTSSITISGRGGSFTTGNLNLQWNNENAWSSLQTFQRSALGGIDLDWMTVGCNAVILPYPKGQMPLEEVSPNDLPDFFIAVGYKILTPNGASQFFYPGARNIFLQSPTGGLINVSPPPANVILWFPTDSDLQANPSLQGIPSGVTQTYANPPTAPIIPVSSDNLSPYVQLPVFGGVYYDVYLEEQDSPQSTRYNYAYNPNWPAWNLVIELGMINGLNAILAIESVQNDPTLTTVIAQAYNTNVYFELDNVIYNNSYPYATINFTAKSKTLGPYTYFWGYVPGGCGVIPPSTPTNGLDGLVFYVYSSGIGIPGTYPNAIPGLYTYPIMQVPVGPDIFLVSST